MDAFLLSFAVIFVAELDDKTMLATITLATREEAIGTWLGSIAGMVAADAIAIGVGRFLGMRLPDPVVRVGAAAAFVVFGVALVGQGLIDAGVIAVG